MGAAGRTMSPEDGAEGLWCLNSMVDSWKTERCLVYAQKRTEIPVVANKDHYTIGPTGADITLDDRPTKLNGVGFVFTNTTPNIEYEMIELTDQEWRALSPKVYYNTSSTKWYYSAEAALGLLYLWPITNQNIHHFAIYTWEVVQEFGSDGDVVVVPPGYREALEYNLALSLAERNPKLQNMSPTSVQRAKESKANIKAINGPHLLMRAELAAGSAKPNRGHWDISSNRYV